MPFSEASPYGGMAAFSFFLMDAPSTLESSFNFSASNITWAAGIGALLGPLIVLLIRWIPPAAFAPGPKKTRNPNYDHSWDKALFNAVALSIVGILASGLAAFFSWTSIALGLAAGAFSGAFLANYAAAYGNHPYPLGPIPYAVFVTVWTLAFATIGAGISWVFIPSTLIGITASLGAGIGFWGWFLRRAADPDIQNRFISFLMVSGLGGALGWLVGYLIQTAL